MGDSEIRLPEPSGAGTGLFKVIAARRSTRSYAPGSISLSDAAHVLFAAQGVTGRGGQRTIPSAGATYPLCVRLVAGLVEGLDPGVYRYDPHTHSLEEVAGGDLRADLGTACLGQSFISSAPASIAISATYELTTTRYGQRGVRYVHMEAGHVAQNVHLMAGHLGLGTVVVGAFYDKDVAGLLALTPEETPLIVMPMGPLLKKP